MPFSPKNLSVLAYANGLTLWNYVHDGDVREVDADFFRADHAKFATGDIVLVVNPRAGDGALASAVAVVLSVFDGGVVIAVPMLASNIADGAGA